MCFVDDVELGLELGGSVFYAFPEVADVVDSAVAGGVDLDHVRRGARVDRDAAGADITRTVHDLRIKAVDGLGQEACGCRLAGATWSAKEIGMSDSVLTDRIADRANDVL